MSQAEPMLRPHTQREAEQKFRVHGLFRLPDLRTVDGVSDTEDLGTVELESAYYDTADLRLAREGITLSRRTGDDEGWHLKIPADHSTPGVRDEIRLPLSSGDTVPAELLWTVRAIVRTVPVTHVSTLRTERSIVLLKSPKAKPVAELVDDTVHVVGEDGTVAARFRELELEKRRGGKAMANVAALLTSAGAVGGEFVAKLVRALGPAAAGPPEVPAPARPRPKDAAAATIVGHLATHVRALRSADLAFRRSPQQADDADDVVHQMVAAASHVHAGLRTFTPLLAPEWPSGTQAELSWFIRSLGNLSENQRLRARLLDHTADLPETMAAGQLRDHLSTILDADVASAHEATLQLLDSRRYLALHDALVEAANTPATTDAAGAPARDVLPALVRDAWKQLSKSASAVTTGSPAEQWHDVQRRATQARDSAAAVAAALGSDAAAFSRQMARLVEVLAEHEQACHAVVALQRLVQQTSDPELVFALGAMARAEYDHARAARINFATIWPEARKPKWRRWLTPP